VAHHIHESPRIMTTPLIILAVLALLGGLIGIPHLSAIEGFLEPVFAHLEPHTAESSSILEWVLMALSGVVAIVAMIIAQYMYLVNPTVPGRLRERYPSLHRLLANKYYVDEIYMAGIVSPLRKLANFFRQSLDAGTIDAAVNGLASLFRRSSEETRKLQTGYVRNYGLAMLMGVVVVLGYLILR
jgi:NADH-quinone oxidoreductase subunit L